MIPVVSAAVCNKCPIERLLLAERRVASNVDLCCEGPASSCAMAVRVFPPLQRVLFCSTYTLLSVSPSFQHDHSTHWTYSPSRVCSGCKTFTCILFSRIGFSSTWVFASLWSPWKERVFLPLESELETEQFVDAESASVSQHPTRCHADPTS